MVNDTALVKVLNMWMAVPGEVQSGQQVWQIWPLRLAERGVVGWN